MDFQPTEDSRWELIQDDTSTFFEDITNQIEFHPKVGEDVKKRFEVVRKLILHSYFEYEFLDVASNHALFTFELALKKRYEELEGNPEDERLFDLIKWGSKNHLFEDDEQVIHSLRKLRNHDAHPEQFTLGGFTNIDVILRTVEVINDMYADPALRLERKEKTQETDQKLKDFLKGGAILETDSNRYIIFHCSLLYFDNHKNKELYYILAWPIFYPKFKDGHMDFCEPLLLKAVEIKFCENEITFDLSKKSKVHLQKIQKEENQARYNNFIKGFRQNGPAQQLVNMKIGEKRLAVTRNI